ncbi:MAG TPA: hypothetical protein VN961_03725 [Streptosporangiaceae bacterium]|nr:hypothetical protein [Streptosporangiaceae bacterium]
MELNVPLHVIGVVRTRHTFLETTPIQAALNRAERGTIEIDATYRDGLDSLGGGPRRINPIGLSLITYGAKMRRSAAVVKA